MIFKAAFQGDQQFAFFDGPGFHAIKQRLDVRHLIGAQRYLAPLFQQMDRTGQPV